MPGRAMDLYAPALQSIRRSASTTSPPQPTTEDLLPNVRSRRKRRSGQSDSDHPAPLDRMVEADLIS